MQWMYCFDQLHLQHRLYGTQRRCLLGLRRWNLQNHNRHCDVHSLSGELRSVMQWMYCFDQLHLQHRLYGTQRRCLLGLRRWNLQNHNRHCDLHSMSSRHNVTHRKHVKCCVYCH